MLTQHRVTNGSIVSSLIDCEFTYTPAPIARSGERWISELTGSESPVRTASALAICS